MEFRLNDVCGQLFPVSGLVLCVVGEVAVGGAWP